VNSSGDIDPTIAAMVSLTTQGSSLSPDSSTMSPFWKMLLVILALLILAIIIWCVWHMVSGGSSAKERRHSIKITTADERLTLPNDNHSLRSNRTNRTNKTDKNKEDVNNDTKKDSQNKKNDNDNVSVKSNKSKRSSKSVKSKSQADIITPVEGPSQPHEQSKDGSKGKLKVEDMDSLPKGPYEKNSEKEKKEDEEKQSQQNDKDNKEN
jgi:FtsZ-interacting cell division protein ZipA